MCRARSILRQSRSSVRALKSRAIGVDGYLVDRVRARDADGDGTALAAWLFIAAGLIGFVGDVIGGILDHWILLAVGLDMINVVIGVCARFVPWNRVHPRAVLVLPALALANLSINIVNGLVPVSTEAVWLVLVFVWIGQWQPPRAAIAMGPVAALAYSLPFAFGTPVTSTAVIAVATSVPLAVLVGETIARKERRLGWRRSASARPSPCSLRPISPTT
jgi:hypothetical protein